jgi:RNA polymerase sigma factor (TIGR02999 family)
MCPWSPSPAVASGFPRAYLDSLGIKWDTLGGFMAGQETLDVECGPEAARDRAGTTRALLEACRDGDRQAFENLVTMLYQDLRRIARRQLRRSAPGQTLNTTGLVHETYLKLAGDPQLDCNNRGHFLAIMARAMRQVMIDYCRRRQALRRGGDRARVPLHEAEPALSHDAERLIVVDQLLEGLARLDQRLVKVVECRFFAGFTEDETAEALGVSRATVQRDWLRARAWLRQGLDRASKGGGGD